MGPSEAPTLDSLGPDADSPLRQPRQFFQKLLLGGATLGVLMLPLVVALLGAPWALLTLLLLAMGLAWIKCKRPSALDAALRTTGSRGRCWCWPITTWLGRSSPALAKILF